MEVTDVARMIFILKRIVTTLEDPSLVIKFKFGNTEASVLVIWWLNQLKLHISSRCWRLFFLIAYIFSLWVSKLQIKTGCCDEGNKERGHYSSIYNATTNTFHFSNIVVATAVIHFPFYLIFFAIFLYFLSHFFCLTTKGPMTRISFCLKHFSFFHSVLHSIENTYLLYFHFSSFFCPYCCCFC